MKETTFQKVEIKKHDCCFKSAKDANKYLQLADAFLESHPEIIYWTERNSSKKGVFYKYSGGVYKEVSTLEVEQMLIDFKPPDSHILIPSLLSQGKQMETMNNIMRRRFFYRDSFNPEGIVNFRNGFYSIDDDLLNVHTMNIISTNQLPYTYNKNADCPCFMKALCDATSGDFAKISVIQEFAGYCLTRDTKLEKMLFLIGAAGSGKSTVLDGITAMLGEENVSCATMEKIGQPRYAGLFVDKIANIATEIPKDVQGFEESLKAVVSGEKITVDTKFIPSYDARPFCKFIFAGNDLPTISDTSDAIFRRMLLVYFNNAIPQDAMDTNLKAAIRKEGAGIFNWAVDGLKRLKKHNGFTITADMKVDIDVIKLQNNSVYYFMTENYEVGVDKDNYVVFDELYEHFKDFCFKVGAKGIYKKVVFGKELRKIYPKDLSDGVKWISNSTRKVFYGVRTKGSAPAPQPATNEPITWTE